MKGTNPSPESSKCTPVEPQWEPPDGMSDPLVARRNVDRDLWKEAFKRRLPGASDYGIAFMLAEHGNPDGTNCFPGVKLLAEEAHTTEKSVKKCLAWLIEHGWIRLVARGARKSGLANHYRLTIPAPLAAEWGRPADRSGVRLPYWTAEDGPQWIERPEGEDARQASRARIDPVEVGAKHHHTLVSRAPLELSRAPDGGVVEGREVPPPPYDPLSSDRSPTARLHSGERRLASQAKPASDDRDSRRGDYPAGSSWIVEDDPDETVANILDHASDLFDPPHGLEALLLSKITPPVDEESFEELPFDRPDPRYLMNIALKACRWGTTNFTDINERIAAGEAPPNLRRDRQLVTVAAPSIDASFVDDPWARAS